MPQELTPLSVLQDPSGRHLQGYVPFAKGSGHVRSVSPLKLREPEPEKKHGGHFGAGPPHSPKVKVRGPSSPILMLTA